MWDTGDFWMKFGCNGILPYHDQFVSRNFFYLQSASTGKSILYCDLVIAFNSWPCSLNTQWKPLHTRGLLITFIFMLIMTIQHRGQCNYFLCCVLQAPVRGFWLLWVGLLSPWFFQQAPALQETDEKKQRKLERRMKRHWLLCVHIVHFH
jgi:hypothetical protein